MFNHYLGFLRDVVWVQPHKAHQCARSRLALDVRIYLAVFQELVVCRIGRVVLKNVEDESFLYCLPHRVFMELFTVAAKHGKCPVFGGRRERKETQICLLSALGHATE